MRVVLDVALSICKKYSVQGNLLVKLFKPVDG